MQGQQQPQVGMVLMPDNHIDMSLFDAPTWNNTASSGDYHPQVFAVTEVPAGPVLDLTPCFEKTQVFPPSKTSSAKLLPSLPELPMSFDALTVNEKTSAQPFTSKSVPSPSSTLSNQRALAIRPKAGDIGLSTTKFSIQTLETPSEHLESACLELEQSSARLAALLPPDDA